MDVRFSLGIRTVGGQIVSRIAAGTNFFLTLTVQDLRAQDTWLPQFGVNAGKIVARPRGLFSAYCNIFYDTNYVRTELGKTNPRFSPMFPNYPSCKPTPAGLMCTGSFASFSPTGRSSVELMRILMLAATPNNEEFFLSVSDLDSPTYDTTVFGVPGLEERRVLPDNIELIGTSLLIE